MVVKGDQRKLLSCGKTIKVSRPHPPAGFFLKIHFKTKASKHDKAPSIKYHPTVTVLAPVTVDIDESHLYF